jgi:hypothetical protein
VWPPVWPGDLAATSSDAWTALAGASVAPRPFFLATMYTRMSRRHRFIRRTYAGTLMDVDPNNCVGF